MALDLDRIEIESVGGDPVRLARAIHRQMPDHEGAVPVHDIAHALDIEEIRERPLNSFEGCLITDRDKSRGAILVNASSGRRRRRYSVAHELCHFLSEKHEPTEPEGFRCTSDDMAYPARSGQHLKQEREANSFAIELLAPERLIRHRLRRPADLEHVLAIATDLDISREAAARRYAALHDERLAVVFSAGERVRYVEKGNGFPATAVWANDKLPPLPRKPRDDTDLTTLDEVSAHHWLSRPNNVSLYLQTLYQAKGYGMTLLVLEAGEDDAADPRM